MEVHFSPELEARIAEIVKKTGKAPDDLVEDAMAGYLDDLEDVRRTLDRRYAEVKSGRVQPIDGEQFFEELRQRENELLKRRGG